MTENPVSVSQALTPERPIVSPRRLILPLALAQFICSFAGSNMNVMINDISAAAGQLIGGIITTGISWRAAFIFQALVIVTIIFLSRRLVDPLPTDPTRPFDAIGAILSGVGMFCVVFGILQAGSNNVLFAVFLVIGAAFLGWFFLYIRARERAGKEALLSTGLFKNRTCNLALVTQNIQWLVLMGTSFVVSVFLQTVRGY